MNWISVKDKLPNNYEHVLATDGKQVEKVIFNENDHKCFNRWWIGWFAGDAGGTFSPEPYSYHKYLYKVTYWMPLPKPPNATFPESTSPESKLQSEGK